MTAHKISWRLAILVVGGFAAITALSSQAAPAPPVGSGEVKPFKTEELEQLAAPIALYPDSLLAQIFMASTYPVEVVQAERWLAANKDLKGAALTAELEKKEWDPSIKSLINFPKVLVMMSEQLDWTTRLGDAFLGDQKGVMDAVQRLRAKAKASGNLKDAPEQKIVVQQESPAVQVISIESPSPDVVYVPSYNPTVVYGAWAYPAYPPPPPYYPPPLSNAVSFGAGVAVGFAWGYAWGHCDWNHGNVDVDVDRNANINRNINRDNYKQDLQNRTGKGQGQNAFQHDAGHRKGVSYRDQATNGKYSRPGGGGSGTRDEFRGRADAGRQELARGGDSSRGGDRAVSPRGDGGRDAGGRSSAASSRGSSQGRGNFSGADRGGAGARADSARGQASRGGGHAAPRGGGRGGRR